MQGASAVESGVRFLAMAAPQTVAALAAGGLAAATGAYLPIMLAGGLLCAVGTGLLILLNADTPTLTWAAYMALTGFGEGLAVNMPYTAIQVMCGSDADVFVGNAVATFGTLAGGGVGIGLGSNLLRNTLAADLPRLHLPVSADALATTGPGDLAGLPADAVRGLHAAFARAVAATNVAATITVALGTLAVLGMHWRNLKTVARQRAMREREETEREEARGEKEAEEERVKEGVRLALGQARRESIRRSGARRSEQRGSTIGFRLSLPAWGELHSWDEVFV